MKNILFVCTGNYYRSRMAEEIFNYWSQYYELNWKAGSAGLRSDMSASPNVGSISKHAVEMLGKGDYPIESKGRWPRSMTEKDFNTSDLIICLNHPEHRPAIEDRFESYAEEPIYWEVPDIDELEPEIAFQLIVFEVGRLIYQLSTSHSDLSPADDLRSQSVDSG